MGPFILFPPTILLRLGVVDWFHHSSWSTSFLSESPDNLGSKPPHPQAQYSCSQGLMASPHSLGNEIEPSFLPLFYGLKSRLEERRDLCLMSVCVPILHNVCKSALAPSASRTPA